MDLLRRIRLFARAHPYWMDTLLAFGLYGLTLVWRDGGPTKSWSEIDPSEVLVVAGFLVYAPLALRRRYPVSVLALTVAATVGYMFVGPVRGPILAGAGLGIYTVCSVVERRLALAIGGIAVLSVGIASMALSPEKWDQAVNGYAFAWTAMTVAIGEAVRSRRAFVAAIEERARRAEHTREEEARRRVAEERLRIARELHDIVGHHIALINIQAGVASTVLATQPDTAREALAQVREAGRAALTELGATVAVLRQTGENDENSVSPREPAPGLDQLPALLAKFEKAGLRVERHVEGVPQPLPATVDLTAYRVVQESLTNVGKHAGSSSAVVRLDYRSRTLRIEVEDEGPTGGPSERSDRSERPERGERGDRAARGEPRTSGGYGIIGMRERAATVGGSFRAGPRPDGGFRVVVELPYEPGAGSATPAQTTSQTTSLTTPAADAPAVAGMTGTA
ncbi:sensor histidine kinase [Streptacidiphilus sp. MAP5-3]|uniref:sensor histidine kinase n=1 Tax=unclassified Streptacidiphilus TaxID=2643834 RepID=UPI00351849EA